MVMLVLFIQHHSGAAEEMSRFSPQVKNEVSQGGDMKMLFYTIIFSLLYKSWDLPHIFSGCSEL